MSQYYLKSFALIARDPRPGTVYFARTASVRGAILAFPSEAAATEYRDDNRLDCDVVQIGELEIDFDETEDDPPEALDCDRCGCAYEPGESCYPCSQTLIPGSLVESRAMGSLMRGFVVRGGVWYSGQLMEADPRAWSVVRGPMSGDDRQGVPVRLFAAYGPIPAGTEGAIVYAQIDGEARPAVVLFHPAAADPVRLSDCLVEVIYQ